MSNNIHRSDLAEARKTVYLGQNTPEMQALMAIAEAEKAKALAAWRRADGPGLVSYQAEYNTYQGIIDLITKQPHSFEPPIRS